MHSKSWTLHSQWWLPTFIKISKLLTADSCSTYGESTDFLCSLSDSVVFEGGDMFGEVSGYHVEEEHFVRVKFLVLLYCADLEQVCCVFSSWQFALLQFLHKYNRRMWVLEAYKRVSLSFCTLHFSVACLMCTIGQHCFSCLNPSLSLTSSPSLIAAVAAVALADHRREHREWKELSYRLNVFPKGLISPIFPVLLIDFLLLFILINVELFHIWNPSK